jgi:hypothetical protein
VIIDEFATRNTRFFDEQPGFATDYEHVVLDGNLRDPEIWRRIAEVVRAHGNDPIVILGSGDDGTNLHAALRVRKHHPQAYVIVRSFRTSPFMDEVASEAGAHPFNLGQLVQNGMPDGWL